MDQEFADRIVLVTGGGRNVGRATALEFARRGAHVIVNYFHSPEAAAATVEVIRSAGGSGETIRASVAKRESVREMFAAIRKRHGRIDVLVNNAAQGVLRDLDELTDLEWEKTYRTNVHGVRWCMEHAIPLLEAGSGKAIVNLSSIGSTHALGAYAVVGSSKAALEALTRYFAAELGPSGIRVNTASGSLLHNPVADAFPNARQVQELCDAATPLRRPSEQDLTDAVVFLASPRAASITGQTLVVDGGMTLGQRMLTVPDGRPPAWTERTPGVRVGLRPAVAADADVDAGSEGTGQEGARQQQTQDPGKPAGAAPRVREVAVGDPDRLVAVVGMGLAVPGANDPEEFWTLLNRGEHQFSSPSSFNVEGIYSPDPRAEDRSYCRAYGSIRNFVPHPRLAEEIASGGDPDHDGAVSWLRHSVLQARDTVRNRPGYRHACYIGAWPGGIRTLEETILKSAVLRAADAAGGSAAHRRRVERVLDEHFRAARSTLAPATPENVVRRAISGILPDDTVQLIVDTACASSVYSVDLGVKDLLTGNCDIAYCGGVNSGVRRDMVLFAKLRGLSTSGQVRSFDEAADGVLFSESAAVVALKRLRQAQEDGDPVLGLVAGFGSSSDGRGKAISAPDARGQRLAVTRARAVNDVRPEEVDWIVGHGTGTPVGDRVELSTLAELASDEGVLCTSNKAVVGHGGWVAGVISLIHTLLAMRHDRIPGQPYFTALPPGIDESRIRVPCGPAAWPTGPRPRTAGLSGFGFGGTNAHLLVRDTTPAPESTIRSAPEPSSDEIVLVGWSSHLPGDFTQDDLRRWLAGSGPGPRRSFGPDYPAPPLRQLPLPPITARTIDRCQLMAVSATHAFVAEHGELWTGLRERTGVIAAHSGPPRSLVDYTLRVTAGSVDSALRSGSDDVEMAATRQSFDDAMSRLRDRVPPSNDDSMPGVLTNVIPSRVANRFDLNGACMTVSSGHASLNAGLHVAAQYLRFGELDVALVLGINGNSTWSGAETFGRAEAGVAEGAFLFMLSRASTAREHGWPVLAGIDSTYENEEMTIPEVEWGSAAGEQSYLGGDNALALLRGLCVGMPALRLPGRGTHPAIVVRRTGETGRPPRARDEEREVTEPPGADIAARHVLKIRREDEAASGAGLPVIPRGGIVLTDSDDLARDLADQVHRAQAVLVTTGGLRAPEGALQVAEFADADAISDVLDDLVTAQPHIRVVTRAPDPVAGVSAPSPALLRLQDLVFLLLKRFGGRAGQGSVGMVLLDRLINFDVHPDLALFTGLARSLVFELDGAPVLAVVSDGDLGTALDEWERESRTSRARTVVRYRSGRRHVECLRPAPLPAVKDTGLLREDECVVLATGGARGITAETMALLAASTQAKLWLVGTVALDDVPDDIADAQESAQVLLRNKYLSAWRAEDPDRRLPDLVRRFDDLWHSREALANVRRLQRLAGSNRIRYAPCDLRDEAAVAALVDRIRAEDGRVDIVVHGAGRNHAGRLATKTLAHFREVRDVKVLGYVALKRALADLRPRRWYSFGSLVAVLGGEGEVDYAAANEFLLSSAHRARTLDGHEETTVCWSLWRDVGIGAEPSLRKVISRRGALSGMPTAEGVRHFAAELAADANPEATSVYVGRSERAHLSRLLSTATSPPDSLKPIGSALVERRDNYALWECRPDPGRDQYLLDHVYRGRCVIPAALFSSLALTAAERLRTDHRSVSVLQDLVFSEFMFTDLCRAEPLFSLHVEQEDERRVRVSCTSDLVDSRGRVLRRDRRHCALTAVFGPRLPPSGIRRDRPDMTSAVRLVRNPYAVAESPVQVTGILDTLFDIRLHPDANTCRWICRTDPAEFFGAIPETVTLIDAMGQLSLLRLTGDDHVSVKVPQRISRLHYPVCGNDLELMRRYSTGLDLTYFADQDVCVATAPDGEVVAELHHAEGLVVAAVPLASVVAPGTVLPAGPTSSTEEARQHDALQAV
ncbi:Polyketide synthase dehydratase [Lentzea xinjiangensis]|uniref:Polyketide synthase dehydratase n=1 Tax=Lentzea xinjiangensis TaxID=402600 RepID=A0A1H9WS84_9PSEU|nr:SDR family oxidoreductase [Lentzea xinjiangensis]SES36684.1 Polyketide synthase dehydratase [Lentzea xinjiangensis]